MKATGVLMAQQRFSQELVSQMKMPQKRATRWQRWLQGTANLLLMVNLLKTGWWKWLRTFVLRRSKTLPTFACLVTLWHGELRTFRPILRDRDKGCRVWFFSVSLRQSTDATDIAQLLIFWEEWMVNVNVSKELRSKTPADGAAALDNFYCPLDNGRFQEIRTFGKKIMSLFGSTYLCEKTFSLMNFNKNRVRTRPSGILHIKTTVFKPDLTFLLQSKSQYHPSH